MLVLLSTDFHSQKCPNFDDINDMNTLAGENKQLVSKPNYWKVKSSWYSTKFYVPLSHGSYF